MITSVIEGLLGNGADMETTINILTNNYEWIFSGIGVFIIGFFLKRRFSATNKVKQKNIIAGGDVVGRDKRN